MDIFSEAPILEHMKRYLDYSVQRQKVITSNIANLETPGYRARDLDFKEIMKTELNQNHAAELKTSDPRHFSGRPALIRRSVIEEVATDALGNDANNVDLDREMTALAKNVLEFSVVSQMFQKKIHMIEYSIKEGRV